MTPRIPRICFPISPLLSWLPWGSQPATSHSLHPRRPPSPPSREKRPSNPHITVRARPPPSSQGLEVYFVAPAFPFFCCHVSQRPVDIASVLVALYPDNNPILPPDDSAIPSFNAPSPQPPGRPLRDAATRIGAASLPGCDDLRFGRAASCQAPAPPADRPSPLLLPRLSDNEAPQPRTGRDISPSSDGAGIRGWERRIFNSGGPPPRNISDSVAQGGSFVFASHPAFGLISPLLAAPPTRKPASGLPRSQDNTEGLPTLSGEIRGCPCSRPRQCRAAQPSNSAPSQLLPRLGG